ncbi:MAG: alanine--tRNA ligase [Myxococcota bacterium]|nr:alanine--tRNA ligase [Myxococcota bacterium]
MPLAAREIREEFLAYFESRGHQRVASASLVPEADPTLMFVNAGMVPFKRLLLGEETRSYLRATSSQKVMRVSGKHNDLENVGRTPRHHTFFEMLGNFSFGDYFKQEAIEFAWELLTQRLGIEASHLVVSVFREDDAAAAIWERDIGLPGERIFRLDEDENFWSMGETGPCGPCSEIHYDFGAARGEPLAGDPSDDTGRFLEVWNLVFMQFNRDSSGVQTPLPKPSIDTGAGLERLAQVIQGVSTNYETDVFTPILARAQEVSGVSLGADPEHDVSLKVIADHARALAFLIGDGVLPANEGRGYVLRRILRRAARHAKLLGTEEPMVYRVADAVVDEMAGAYPDLAERRAYICDRIRRDEERFLETLSKGLALLEDEVGALRERDEAVLPGDVVFKLYDTYGFPSDLTEDILAGQGLGVDHAGYDAAMQAQRERARAAWKGSGDTAIGEIYGRIAADLQTEFVGYDVLEASSAVSAVLVDGELVDSASEGTPVEFVVAITPFYAESGGQVGDRGVAEGEGVRVEIDDVQQPVEGLFVHRGRVVSGTLRTDAPLRLSVEPALRQATVRNHSGTHLLHAALREVLGPQAMQKGSLVSPERLRFDFTHDAPLSREQIECIEDLANEWIEANAERTTRVMSYTAALEAGAVAIFEEKYGDEVRVLSFGEFSTELCGGTHAGATGEIGLIKIVSETGIAAGVRRLEAVTGMAALRWIRERGRLLDGAAELLKAPASELPERIERLLDERKRAQRKIESLEGAQRGEAAGDLVSGARDVGGAKVIGARVDGLDARALRELIDDLRNRLGTGVVCVASETEGKALVAVGVTQDLTHTHKAGDLVRDVAKVVGGGGGGRPDFAQAGGKDPSRIDAALEKFHSLVEANA